MSPRKPRPAPAAPPAPRPGLDRDVAAILQREAVAPRPALAGDSFLKPGWNA